MLTRTGTFIIMLTLPTLVNPLTNALQVNAFPPPVRQNIGFFDVVFNDLVIAECFGCHGTDTLSCHHSLEYGCLDCHKYHLFGTMAVNCFNCHEQQPGDPSVHHLTEAAQQGECASCHQGLVVNLNDKPALPTYPATMITPRLNDGLGPDGRGSCRYCHDWGNDELTGELIFSAEETHHGHGFKECLWCHGLLADESLAVRACEQCHTPLLIHNIQADSNGDGVIIPGGEAAGYGHIGNNADCLGCHGGFADEPEGALRKGAAGNPTRHHVLVQTEDKQCLDCHSLTLNQDGLFVFDDFRTCTTCHKNRHH